jgi:TetR/AcrR family transcriptional regulator
MELATQTEAKIIQAATEVFLEKGKDGARMHEIAQRADINKALLHYYFRSKDKLYETVFRERVFRFLDELFSSVPETDDIKTVLKEFVENYIDLISTHPELVRFILWEVRQGGQYMGDALKDIFAKHGFTKFPFLEKVQNAINAGTIRPLDPLQLIISVIGVCVYPFIAQPLLENAIPGVQVTSPAFLQKRKEEIFKLIWEGIHP